MQSNLLDFSMNTVLGMITSLTTMMLDFWDSMGMKKYVLFVLGSVMCLIFIFKIRPSQVVASQAESYVDTRHKGRTTWSESETYFQKGNVWESQGVKVTRRKKG